MPAASARATPPRCHPNRLRAVAATVSPLGRLTRNAVAPSQSGVSTKLGVVRQDQLCQESTASFTHDSAELPIVWRSRRRPKNDAAPRPAKQVPTQAPAFTGVPRSTQCLCWSINTLKPPQVNRAQRHELSG